VATLCSVIWRYRNDILFKTLNIYHLCRLLYGNLLTMLRGKLQHDNTKNDFIGRMSSDIEVIVLRGWRTWDGSTITYYFSFILLCSSRIFLLFPHVTLNFIIIWMLCTLVEVRMLFHFLKQKFFIQLISSLVLMTSTNVSELSLRFSVYICVLLSLWSRV
jgi:hypothetical protein